MHTVRRHFDKWFAKYPKTDETLDLKEEVIGNVEAEIEDLQGRGLSFEEAFRISVGKMDNLDEVIEGVKSVRLSKIVIEVMQWTLIYTLIAWILTIPLSVFYSVRRTSWVLFLIVIFIGIIYLFFYIIRGSLLKKSVKVNLYKIVALRKFVWIIWLAFIIVKWGMVTAILFGSNIWFWRQIYINGPYEFATICVMYVSPIITVIVPLLLSKLQKIIVKEGEAHLDEE